MPVLRRDDHEIAYEWYPATTPDGAAATPLLLIAPPTSMFDFSPLATNDRPTWIAFGDRDALVNRTELIELAKRRTDLTIDVLTGSDHVFTRGLTELGARAATWLDDLR